MRILHFISSPAAGGAETYVRDLSILMRQRGHDVHIVFLQTAGESGHNPDFERQFLRSLSSKSISYSFIGKEARKKPWLGGFRLREAVRSFSADIVHCHLYYSVLFSFFLFKIPVIYTHHNIKLGLPKFFYHLFDRKIKAYIAICSACRNLLTGRDRKVVQINNAVSRERVGALKLKGSDSEVQVTCVYVGSLCAQKNLSLMINAFVAIADRNVRLLIVGEGPDMQYLDELVSSLGIEKKVEFLGNRSNVSEILAESDVFLMSSAWEGLPISLIEASLTGLPVIVTNVGGCAEVVHQCANGFVVDDLNVASYAAALQKMVGDSELRDFFSRNAFEFSGAYEIEEAVNKHLEVYQKVIERQYS